MRGIPPREEVRMSNLVLSREVYCPIEEVWAYHTDLTRAPEYWPNLAQARRLDAGQGPPEVGTTYEWTYNMFGRTFSGTISVTAVEPNERFAFEATGGIQATFRHEYRATAKTRTRITVFVEYEVPSVLGKVANALFIERRNAADADHAMDQLKDILEAEVMARVDAGVV